MNIFLDIETATWSPPEPALRHLILKCDTEKKLQKLQEQYALHPYTGQIVAIGVGTKDNIVTFSQTTSLSEEDILHLFWHYVLDRTSSTPEAWRIVTYYGKEFDIPFIKIRSAILSVRPLVHLSTRKYETDRHADLFEILGEQSQSFWGKLFGYQPKCLIDGSEIPQLFLEGKMEQILQKLTEDLEMLELVFDKMEPFL